MNKKTDLKRRRLLRGISAIPLVALGGYHHSASAEMLSVEDPVAKNLEYTETTPYPEQTCANCRLYTGGSAQVGGCPLFGRKQVVAAGWCKSWVAR